MTETISQLTDEQIIRSVESIGNQAATDGKLLYGFSINKTFFIQIEGGEGFSYPPKVLEDLSKYEKLTIELYHYKDPPPIEETHMDPIEFSYTEDDGTVKVYRFEFDVQVFPHICIDPKTEEPFKNQPWAGSFQRGNFVNYSAMLPWRDLCDVIRYCDKISRLKLFW